MDKISDIRILYIEDERPLCELFKFAIEEKGYQVDFAITGEEGLALWAKTKYDLVALDYLLPDMTGVDIARKLLADNPDCPLLMVTGKGNERIAVEALTLGIANYVIKGDKSVYLELIPDYIANLLERARQRREHIEAQKALWESEQRYRGLIAASPVAIYEINLHGEFLSMNPAGLKMVGIENQSDIYGLSYLDIPVPEDRERISDLLSRAQQGEGSLFEFSSNSKSGPLHFSNSFEPIRDADNKIMKVMGVTQDITERKIFHEQLLRSQRMEAVGQLTGGIAHDFNNLLHVMIGNSEVLEGEVSDNTTAMKSLEIIQKAVDRAAALTSRLLAFSRKQTLSPRSTAINALVLNIGDMLQRALGETVELITHMGSGASDAQIDPHQFETALVNLALNARDAMPNGGTLTIETSDVFFDKAYAARHEDVTPGNYVKVTVSDTGEGIAPEALEKVFEPFFTTKEVGEGSGLGLSMVYGFAKQSKGHITVHSKLNHGTIIELYIPRSTETISPNETDADSGPGLQNSERILIVEDDEGVRGVSATLLSTEGYDITVAENGEEAVNILENEAPFNLLFTDVVLPGGMNGVEIAEHAKQIQPDIKVLYTTGYAENTIAHKGQLISGTTLINKPFRRADLLEKIRTLLDGS